ncbi:MAG: thioredoxin family protein [Blastocatellia bacterium]
MYLDRDEFLVTYDSAKADGELLVKTIRDAGYTARVVSGKNRSPTAPMAALPGGFSFLDEAVAKAKAENKPIVLDLFAKWCAPCRRLERDTFPDARVKALLDRTIFLRIDTDKYPAIAQRLGVEGLPDIRFVMPDGEIVRQLRSFQDPESFVVELERLLKRVTRK